jgi:hypothetical protein
MVKDLVFGRPCLESYPTTTVSGDETGNEIDNQGFRATRHIIMSGAVTTDIIVKLQETDTSGSGYTDVAAADLVGADTGVNTVTFAATGGDNICRSLGYLGNKRYTRIYVVSGAGALLAIADQEQVLQTAAANS